MSLKWYALRSKPRKEDVVWQQLRGQGFDVFYPRLRVNPVNPRAKKYKPYFPGYMFVKTDIEEVGLSTFQWMPHTLGLVNFGDEVVDVPDSLIDAIRKRVAEIAEAGGEVFDGLKSGDKVVIQSGPFEGYEAIFDTRLPGTERVRVLLQFLGSRRVQIELDASKIQQSRRKHS
jgi:transcription antitermination factor NusG